MAQLWKQNAWSDKHSPSTLDSWGFLKQVYLRQVEASQQIEMTILADWGFYSLHHTPRFQPTGAPTCKSHQQITQSQNILNKNNITL